MCGWILAVSVESKNASPYEENLKHSKSSVKHMLEMLPIDENRIYFTGSSGGGAVAYLNAKHIRAAGIMPHVTYDVFDNYPKAQDYFITGGGRDFNRYHTAQNRAKFKDNAVHRFHPGAHDTPGWIQTDGIVWLNSRYLSRHRNNHLAEIKDFELAMANFIEELQKQSPHRAYATIRFLLDEFELSAPAKENLRPILEKLKEDPKNILYNEGLAELDNFSLKVLSKLGKTNSVYNHTDQKIKKEALLLLEKYQKVPVIEESLKALSAPTAILK